MGLKMSDNNLKSIFSTGENAKIISGVIILLSTIFGTVCFYYTQNKNNLGTKIAEEIVVDIIEVETGVDLTKTIDDLLNKPSDVPHGAL